MVHKKNSIFVARMLLMNKYKNNHIEVKKIGQIEYNKAWDLQTELFNTVIETKLKNRDLPIESQHATTNYLLFCEHPHVYTLGKSGDRAHLLVNNEQLKEVNAQYYEINRGGDITYHGPGQVVGYPIFDLDNFFTDIHKYLRYLEEAIIRTLAEYNIKSGRVEGLTGVWLDGNTPQARKICAMGVKASRWVTMHGFALNVNTNLSYFNNIVPCGIVDKAVTSMEKELGQPVTMTDVEDKISKHIQQLFTENTLD
jgi:lipoyl(octanoyl) transferase